MWHRKYYIMYSVHFFFSQNTDIFEFVYKIFYIIYSSVYFKKTETVRFPTDNQD